MLDGLYEILDPIFTDATCFVMRGFAFGSEVAEHTFMLSDGRIGTVINECSGARLFVVLLILGAIRLLRRDRASWAWLACSPIVAVLFNAIRCMIVLGRGMAFHDIGGFSVFAIPVMIYALCPEWVVQTRQIKIGTSLAFSALCIWIATPAYSNDTKPITPTVRGITLGSPMETPSSVALEWQADEGREIKTNQLVRVYWRDAYTPWTLAAEGYGITNAVINGFFINRDTDWMVEVEDPDEEDDE